MPIRILARPPPDAAPPETARGARTGPWPLDVVAVVLATVMLAIAAPRYAVAADSTQPVRIAGVISGDIPR